MASPGPAALQGLTFLTISPPSSWKYEGHTATVGYVTFSRDNKLVASPGDDYTVAVLNRDTGKALRKYKGHHEQNCVVTAAAFSPDSKRLVSGGWGSAPTVLVWDVHTLKTYFELKGHTGDIETFAWSFDGRLIASASKDKTVLIWDASNGKLLFTLKGHSNWINSVAYSTDSLRLVSGSSDKTAIVWDTRSGQQITRLNCSSLVMFVAFIDGNKAILTANRNKVVQLWDATSWREQRKFETKHSGYLHRASLSPDERFLASVDLSADRSIRLTDVQTGTEVAILADTMSNLRAVAFSADGVCVAADGEDKVVSVWPVPQRLLQNKEAAAGGGTTAEKSTSPGSATSSLTPLKGLHPAILPLSHRNLQNLTDFSLDKAGISDRGHAMDTIQKLTKAMSDTPIERGDIVLVDLLCSGQFGKVYRGTCRGVPVVIKQPHNASEDVIQDYHTEVKLMKAVAPHRNVVQYFGVCTAGKATFLVLEVCAYGSLEDYLRKNPSLAAKTRVHIAVEVAAGMAHVSTFIVHRNLATRNILLSYGAAPHNVTAKVADFGLARSVNSTSGQQRLTQRHPVPLAWSPNEVYEDHSLPLEQRRPHTPASDVWMFATTVWELFNDIPPNEHCVPKPDRTVVPPLNKPERMSANVYALLTRCWAIDPSQRPSFKTLHTELVAIEGSTAF